MSKSTQRHDICKMQLNVRIFKIKKFKLKLQVLEEQTQGQGTNKEAIERKYTIFLCFFSHAVYAWLLFFHGSCKV